MTRTASLPTGLAVRFALATVGALIVSLMLTVLSPVRADAAYYAGSSGRIGSVSLNGPMVNAWDLGTRLGNGTYFYTKNWNVGGFTVSRSPSSWSQTVTGLSTVQRWDGRWVDIQSRRWSGTVSGNGTLSFPAWTWSPTNVPNNRASYRVNFQISWHDYATGQLLAYTAILPNTYGDNRCSTTYFRCTSYTDGVNF